MKVVVGAIGACLLCLAPALAAQTIPVIREVEVENLGQDDVIVVLSRHAPRPFLHASRLAPGESARVPVPGLPDLLADVLRRSEVKRAELEEKRREGKLDDKSGKRKRQALGLALALSQRDRSDDNNDRDERGQRDEREEPQAADQEISYAHKPKPAPREDNYGRRDDEPRDVNPGTNQVILGNFLGNQTAEDKNGPGFPPPDPPRRPVTLGAGDGPREVDGVGLRVATGEGPAQNQLATTTAPPANASASSTTTEPCYCGADMSEDYVAALRRARERIDQLSNDEKGPWDGAWFLSRNAGSMDERVRPVYKTGAPPAGDDAAAGANWLCPSGPCANLPGAGGGTMMLFGVCLPQHVGNDIMYGYVSYLLDVPPDIQNAGGHWAQLNSTYSSWDPPVSRAAYSIGRNLASGLDGKSDWTNFNVGNAGRLFNGAPFFTGNEITTPVRRHKAVDFIRETYPALANCPACAVQPGHIGRDWTKSGWTLSDETRVFAPGFGPEDQPPDDE
jgi:hypothetical protein